jgi:hypothetical protein
VCLHFAIAPSLYIRADQRAFMLISGRMLCAMYLLVDQQTFENVPMHPDLPYLDLFMMTSQQIPLCSIEFRSNY